MNFKDDVMFYLSKGKVINGVNLYEDEDEDEDTEEKEDTKKKKCPKCGKVDCECDKDDDESEADDDEANASTVSEKDRELIQRMVNLRAKARGDKVPEDFGATPEEVNMALDAIIAATNKNKKQASCKCADENPEDAVCRKNSKKSISTKTVADDDDDQYHPKSSVTTQNVSDDDDDNYHGKEKATMREEILAYTK